MVEVVLLHYLKWRRPFAVKREHIMARLVRKQKSLTSNVRKDLTARHYCYHLLRLPFASYFAFFPLKLHSKPIISV